VLKRIWQNLVTSLLKALVVTARIVPRRALLSAASGIGAAGYYASARYRNVGFKNLRMTFGDSISQREVKTIIKTVFQSFAKSFIAEFPWSAGATAQMLKGIVELRQEDKVTIDRLLAMNKGMIVTSAHFGNFELLGPRFQADGYKIAVVVRNDQNSVLAETINDVRRNSYDVIPRGKAARQVLSRLHDGWVVAMLPDQKSDDLLLTFFGIPTGTVAGPAIMAMRTGAPILPIYCVRQPDDSHKIVLGTPIIPQTGKNDDTEIKSIMSQVNESIEWIVRQHPGQWLWIHDRWRNVPELIAREAGEDGMVTA
jgi:KDO2-lipid IV(A) lauroyltransferase